MTFTREDIDALKYVLTELSDEQLYEQFGDVFEVIKEKLRPYKTLLRRKEATQYSNKSYQLTDEI